MKKVILLSGILLAFFATSMNAQRYSDLKLKYNYHLYTPQIGDPYNPTVSGLCSFLIPGLGQIIDGEVGRGIGFFAGSVAFSVLTQVGSQSVLNGNEAGVSTMLLGLGGMLAVDIWAIVDANHVAKVKNMYLRDLKKTSSLSFEVAPYVSQLSINNQVVTPVGMTMRVRF
jgi:hypothetical protein